MELNATCPLCTKKITFSSKDDFWSCRDGLKSIACPLGICVTRERAIGKVILSFFSVKQLKTLSIHEAAPSNRGVSLLLKSLSKNYVQTGFFAHKKYGEYIGTLRNENLEKQTFKKEIFDLVMHLDVLEHLINPFDCLNEIYRTLKPGGLCIFTAPTYFQNLKSKQIAFYENGEFRYVGERKTHGNPQDPINGSLVTWEFGYDLPLLISQRTKFDCEVRRFQNKSEAILGHMTEVYICKKPNVL